MIDIDFPFKPDRDPLRSDPFFLPRSGSYLPQPSQAAPKAAQGAPWVGHRRTTWPEMVKEDQKLGERHHYLASETWALSEKRIMVV